MITCPHGHRSTQQVTNGRTRAGSQRYRCRACRRKDTPAPRPQGYGADVRRRAVQLYGDGMTLRRIGRTPGGVHRSVATWAPAHADTLPAQPPQPASPVEVGDLDDLDDLDTFVGDKKTSRTS